MLKNYSFELIGDMYAEVYYTIEPAESYIGVAGMEYKDVEEM